MPVTARLIGRMPCPLGDNAAAHVKKDGEKRAYIHCPECGFVGPTRSGTQERLLMGVMRPEGKPTAAASPAPGPAAAAPAAAPAIKKRAGLWDQVMGTGAAHAAAT